MKRFYEYTDKYRELLMKSIGKTDSFESLSKLLCNKKLLNCTQLFLNRLFRVTNFEKFIDSRYFLSAFMITRYPEDILGKQNTSDIQMLTIAKEVITRFQQLECRNEPIRKFCKALLIFNTVFTLWKIVDSDSIINLLLQQFITTDNVIESMKNSTKYDPENKLECINFLEKQKVDLQQKAHSIDKSVDLKAYKKLHSQIEEKYKKTYWDLLIDDLKNNKFDLLEKNLLEIRDSICALLPNRKDLQDDIKDRFDIELITQMALNNAFSLSSFINYCDYIISLVISLHSAEQAVKEKEKWEQLKLLIPEQENYLEMLPTVLMMILRMIEEIQDGVQLFNYMVKNKIGF